MQPRRRVQQPCMAASGRHQRFSPAVPHQAPHQAPLQAQRAPQPPHALTGAAAAAAGPESPRSIAGRAGAAVFFPGTPRWLSSGGAPSRGGRDGAARGRPRRGALSLRRRRGPVAAASGERGARVAAAGFKRTNKARGCGRGWGQRRPMGTEDTGRCGRC